MTQVPILTYHGNGINGTAYHNNDHVALAADLTLIQAMGLRIIPLQQLVDWHQGRAADEAVRDAVVLTCDDGTWFDYYDVNHPRFGPQISLFNLLKAHQQAHQVNVHISNFVIVSPAARTVLDEQCLVGQGWWTDEWWLPAQQSGLMSIENHSWDHNHGVLDNDNHNDDCFRGINDLGSCERQIRQAQEFLKAKLDTQPAAQFFAYPYGNYSDYLKQEYLPQQANSLGLQAAFTTEPRHVTRNSDVWAMPRYVCNNDWQNSSQLESILNQ